MTDYILESSAEINLYALDLDFRFIAINKNDVRMMEKYFDFTPRLGESPLDIMDGQEVEALKSNFSRAMAGESFTVLDKIEKKGEVLYWQCLYSPIYNDNSTIIGGSCVVLDVTDERKKDIENQCLSNTDPLTQVYNRRYLENAFTECIIEKSQKITLIITDLDGFKEVNDIYGHQAGDKVLVDFAELLKETMPSYATIARLGGDEFAILLPNVSYFKVSLLAQLIQGKMCDYPYEITTSYGIFTESYDAGLTYIDFYGKADKAMYIHKTDRKVER